MTLIPQRSIDKRLLSAQAQYFSPEEMSEHVNRQLTPAQCKVRVNEILTSKSELDEVQERRLLLIQMAENLEWLRGKRDDPKSWGAINRAFKLLSDQIERSNINVADINTKLSSKYAEYFVNAFSIGLERALRSIMKETGNDDIIDAEIVDDASRLGIEASQEYINRVTVRADAE